MQPKTSEILIEGKRLFGRWGQKWTRGVEERPGLCGRNYCSIGATAHVSRVLGVDNYSANEYLRKAIEQETGQQLSIVHFNDIGTLQDIVPKFGVPMIIRIARMFAPFMNHLRWRQVKRVWCTAIKMAVEDELRQEERCSQTSSF